MEVDWQGALLWGLVTLLAALVIAYYRLSYVLSQTDQVLSVWEYIVETPILCNHVSRIFTMLMKIRNPYSRSIGLCCLYSISGRGIANYRLPDNVP